MPERLYHFYFFGIAIPITVQAPNSQTARTILTQILPLLPDYAYREISGQTTSSLVTGASNMVKNGKMLVWDGKAWKEKLSDTVPKNRKFLWTATGWKEIK